MGVGRAAAEYRRQAEQHPWPPRWLRWLPPSLILVTMALDHATPPRYFFGSLLTASVVLAIFVYRPLGVAATGAIGCLFLAVTVQIEDYIGPMTVVALVVLGSVTLLSVVLCVMLQRAASRYRRVLAVAEAAQLALLRPLPDRIGSLRMAGFYRAADDEALIGGDLYSVRPTPFGVRAIVGDVKGKGINATQTVATVISTFQEAALLHPTLPQVADRIDVALQLDRDNPPPEPVSHTQPEHSADDAKGLVDELFTTAVLLEFTSDARTVQVLDRGHQPLLIVRRHTTSVVPAEHSLPLGMADLLTEPPGTTACRLEPGDILLAYSDGVTEARDSTGTFYPLPERLRHHYATSAQPVSPSDLISFLQEDVTRWAHTLGDDVIAIAFQRI
ncbi:membrane protein [Streptomyces lividans]|uniref:Integral membrane protein n=6 Tax=Streptomyces TaxID=1883 RepID=A0A7U9H9I6_STRLI|nr:integral membrane protein [Streptomyces lividans TK24]EOY46330.1 integral membrane protein [Streptomyces lividans 1326]KKD16067.1 membrane protein [Streptomyces sp. WM6391]MBQ0949520.1 serine/threonine-protein phosphatase [Streptomyces sp. RK76]THA87912.1 serine/threonine-protein phosphatase [Streptomyces sp. LRa12]BDD70840.1 membrane protein [Streptomyces coelicolor]BDE38076.1 membrane protein [Streptomyces lividans]